MTKGIFIRVDVKGTFRGKDHVSTFGDYYREEPGISCYRWDKDRAGAIRNLEQYWREQACYALEDFRGHQVTVFRGEWVGHGTDFEDCATCDEVLIEIDAYEFFKKYYEKEEELWEQFDNEKDVKKAFDAYLEKMIEV